MEVIFRSIDKYSAKYFCGCTLYNYGYVDGISGAIWRTITDGYIASIYWNVKEHDPAIYTTVLTILLWYISVTLGINNLFLIGLVQRKPYMLLPYLMVSGSEVLFVILITIFGSEILKILGFGMRFWLFLVFSIIITVTHAFLWIQSLRLLKHMENSIKRRKEENRIYDKMRKSVLENI